MAVRFKLNKNGIAQVAKSAEVAAKMSQIAQGVIHDAAMLDPSVGAEYSTDVRITSGGAKTSGRAHARAKAQLPEDFKERQKWLDAMPLHRTHPRV